MGTDKDNIPSLLLGAKKMPQACPTSFVLIILWDPKDFFFESAITRDRVCNRQTCIFSVYYQRSGSWRLQRRRDENLLSGRHGQRNFNFCLSSSLFGPEANQRNTKSLGTSGDFGVQALASIDK